MGVVEVILTSILHTIVNYYGWWSLLILLVLIVIHYSTRLCIKAVHARRLSICLRDSVAKAVHARAHRARGFFISAVFPKLGDLMVKHFPPEDIGMILGAVEEEVRDTLSECQQLFSDLTRSTVTAQIKVFDQQNNLLNPGYFASGVAPKRESEVQSIQSHCGLFQMVKAKHAAYCNSFDRAIEDPEKQTSWKARWRKYWSPRRLTEEMRPQDAAFAFPRNGWRNYYRSGVAAPITFVVPDNPSERVLFGALCLDSKAEDCWEDYHLELANFYADQMALVLAMEWEIAGEQEKEQAIKGPVAEDMSETGA